MSKKGGFSAEDRFAELMEAISAVRPKVSMPFYLNLIMDRYGKAVDVNWSYLDQKEDAQSAIQYNIMNSDPPYDYLWNGSRLKKVAAAIAALEEFLESEEAEDFVSSREKAGKTMDTDDLEFWEENLR